ncbi:L,D-transpeptidase [Pseudoxanthomonas sp. 10H]|uniref:L,D-transpeptidase n=1 Tax=Pseudoxanthomonas sp. 10H TaxID=3242729 RepID=UPI00355710CE
MSWSLRPCLPALLTSVLLACSVPLPAGAAVPSWGAKASSPVGTPPQALRPGEWIWDGDASPSGPIAAVVSLTEQRVYVYRNGLPIGISTVSSGKPGHETPTGVFTILQKDKDHRSSTYNNAPMPYQQRLTWDGVALHAGGLPGYPESHGCVHLPSEFARQLFDATHLGMTVVVAQEGTSADALAHPPGFMPIDAASGAEDERPRLAEGESYRWDPPAAGGGPLSILVSGGDRRVLVFQDGVEIGRARFELQEPQRPLGTHVFQLREGRAPGANPQQPDTPVPLWVGLDVPGVESEAGQVLTAARMARVVLPAGFAGRVYPLLRPGTTLMVTDAPVLERQTGPVQRVFDALPPDA